MTVLGTHARMRAQDFLQVKSPLSGSTYWFCLEHSLRSPGSYPGHLHKTVSGTATDRVHGKAETEGT